MIDKYDEKPVLRMAIRLLVFSAALLQLIKIKRENPAEEQK